MKRSTRIFAQLGAVALGVTIGTTLVVPALAGNGTDNPSGPERASQGGPVPKYQVNANGQSYGSSLDARSFEEEPTLIEVIATNGKVGYALDSDLYGETSTSLQKGTGDATPRTINVYAEDGRTVIGEFIIQGKSETISNN